MSVRNIVRIDEDKCTGCGLCVPSCAEGAIEIVDGKARLIAENLCDGLGACLGDCPEGALIVEEREADAFDEAEVERLLKAQKDAAPAAQPSPAPEACGCPGAAMKQFAPQPDAGNSTEEGPARSRLGQWPIQLHLVPPTAPYFQGADLLLAADCVAYSVGGFHRRFLGGRRLAIACPKLDQGQEIYLDKLVTLIDDAQIASLTVMVMEVPCCSGLLRLAREAVAKAQRELPIKMIRVGVQGDILAETTI